MGNVTYDFEFDRRMMHSQSLHLIGELLYSKIFHLYDIKGDERVMRDPLKGVVYSGFDIKDGRTKKTYFIESDCLKDMPLKVKDSERIVDGKKVIWRITKYDSINLQADDTLPTRQFIDMLFPLNHTSPMDLLLAKFVITACTLTKCFGRVVTLQSFGKDGIFDTITGLVGTGANPTSNELSMAKLGQLIDRNFTCFNEVSGESKTVLQNFFLATGEKNKRSYEHSTTGSDKTKSVYDISKYGYCVFYNHPSYYMRSGKPSFEQIFSPAVLYRILPFYMTGQVDDKEFINTTFNPKEVVMNNIPLYKQWISKWHYLRQNFYTYELKHNIKQFKLGVEKGEKVGRWENVFITICTLIQEYAKDEAEFYMLAEELHKRHKDYIKEIKDIGLM